MKNVPGRKTDKADAQWLAKLLRYGLLQGSFIPPAGQRDLRDLTRYRMKLVQERSSEVNRVQGVLERANIKLAAVATDVLGVSGRAILAALIAGEAGPGVMAELAKGRVRSKIPMLEQALQGLVREHHRRLLAMQLAHIDFLDEQIEALNAEIRRLLEELSQEQIPGEPAGPGTGDGRNEETSAMVVSFSQAIQLLDSVPGVDQKGAELVPCLCRMLLGRWCWSHGLTRAFCSLVRGDVVAAADFNLLVFPVVITMAAVCFSNLWREYGGASPQRGLRRVPFR